MKTILVLLIPLYLISISEGGESPKFERLEAFLAWADTKLRADDYNGLASAQVVSKDKTETRVAYIKKLESDLANGSLANIFKGRIFPNDKNTFKLGGHNKELGHCHIDFVKVKGHWQLARIWHCR